MPLLRLNEHYVSIQGEGPNVGKLTQFVRFSGCNMRCPGWPCDTQHAIVPALWKNDPKLDWDILVNKILQVKASTGADHVCVTGGEPFMQDAFHLGRLVREISFEFGMTVDIFTNGSFPFPDWVIQNQDVHIIMDWKLPGSGEAGTNLDVRMLNAAKLRVKDAIKFVIKDQADFEAAVEWSKQLHLGNCEIYVGRVWDCPVSDDDLVQLLQQYQLPWRLNVQLHKYLWPNKERGI